MKMKVYECHNKACSLGTAKQPGRFSGGATPELITTITGNPEPEHHGEGVCPNCGEKGKSVGTEETHKGSDPYQHLHDQIGKKVGREYGKLMSRASDPDDELSPEEAKEQYREISDGTQYALMQMVEREEQS